MGAHSIYVINLDSFFYWMVRWSRLGFSRRVMWFVYILICSDRSLYTGITNNLNKRLKAHNAGQGARYTKGRCPVKLLKYFEVENKSEALKLEYRIKQMARKEKLAL